MVTVGALLADLLRDVPDIVGAVTVADGAFADGGVRHVGGGSGWVVSVGLVWLLGDLVPSL